MGIDIALGARIDKVASPYAYMYQPEFLSLAFAAATVRLPDGETQPFAEAIQPLYEGGTAQEGQQVIFTLAVLPGLLLITVVLLTAYDLVNHKYSLFAFDFLFFFTLGLLGALLVFLWLFTNHTAARENWNLLWALPSHAIAGILLLFRKPGQLIKFYY